MTFRPRIAVLAAALLGCGAEPDGGGPRVLLPEEVPVAWDGAYNGVGDGLGALVPVDVMVYDGATGEPLPQVDVQVWTTDASAIPIPTYGVLVLDGADDALPYVEDPAAYIEFWDAAHDQFVAVSPDELDLVTDTGGVARLYLYVDAFPIVWSTRQLGAIEVIVQAGDDSTTLSLVPR